MLTIETEQEVQSTCAHLLQSDIEHQCQSGTAQCQWRVAHFGMRSSTLVGELQGMLIGSDQARLFCLQSL